jgi:hypothetical protein
VGTVTPMEQRVDDARLGAQLLSGPPATGPVDVVDRLLAVQAQDLRGARLAVRVRTSGLSASDVDRALTDDRSLVVCWLNRGTLHLVRREDYGWLHLLTTPQLATGNARRLAQEGVSPREAERGVEVVVDALATEGPLTRAVLRDRLAAAGVPVAGQALVHVLALASLRGAVVRGPVVGSDQAFVLVDDWLGPRPAEPDRDAALTTLARRYLAGHGPATDRDLAKWAGLPLGDVRRGLTLLDDELERGQDGLVDLVGRGDAGPPPPPRLLGAFDPLLHGWTSREPVLGAYTHVVTTNGLFRPFALVDGRAAATWGLVRGRVELRPFAPLPRQVEAALAQDAADVERFLAS